MYSITDRKSAVKAVQKLLGHRRNGVFCDEDREEIRRIQSKYGIKQNGKVDYKTYLSIKQEYAEMQNARDAERYMPVASNFPYRVGDCGNDVGEINILLSEALSIFGICEYSLGGDCFTEETAGAIRKLCTIFGMEEASEMSASLYVRLRRECGST